MAKDVSLIRDNQVQCSSMLVLIQYRDQLLRFYWNRCWWWCLSHRLVWWKPMENWRFSLTRIWVLVKVSKAQCCAPEYRSVPFNPCLCTVYVLNSTAGGNKTTQKFVSFYSPLNFLLILLWVSISDSAGVLNICVPSYKCFPLRGPVSLHPIGPPACSL